MTIDELSDSAEYLLVPHDYRERLRGMVWAEDFGVGERLEAAQKQNVTDTEQASAEDDEYDIAAICTALNRYALETGKTGHLLEQRSGASRLLQDTSGSMDKLAALLKDIEGNAYASSAIFATLEAATLDEQITEIAKKTQELCKLLKELSPIYTQAAEQKNYSNSLPAPTKGNPPNAPLDKLIATLEKHIKRISARVEGAQYGVTEIADAIAETLRKIDICDMNTKTIKNRLGQGGGYQGWLIAQVEKSKQAKNSD